MDYYTIFEKEADDRNAVLMGIHNKIPSYALWRDIDIENESIEQRIKWCEKLYRCKKYFAEILLYFGLINYLKINIIIN